MKQNSIRWNESGTSIVIVLKRAEFEQTQILSQYYNHNNLTSFQRQLRNYGFARIREDPFGIHEFCHPYFRRGRPDLLIHVVPINSSKREVQDTRHMNWNQKPEPYADDAKIESLLEIYRQSQANWKMACAAIGHFKEKVASLEAELRIVKESIPSSFDFNCVRNDWNTSSQLNMSFRQKSGESQPCGILNLGNQMSQDEQFRYP